MSNGLSMNYADMEACCGEIESIAMDIFDSKANLISRVNTLCEAWDSLSSPVYQDRFATVGTEIDKIGELVNELTHSIRSYINDMNQVDQSYANL